MLILGLETSTRLGSVALASDGALSAEVALSVRATHSETVLDEVDRLLARAGAAPAELGRIVVGAGPGSFTGVRIAAALAKGLCHALAAPLYAYSSLRAVAASVGPGPTCAMFDARREQVYAAAYADGPLAPPHSGPLVDGVDAVLDRLEPVSEWRFAGEGARRHRARIAERGGEVLPAHLGVPRAAALIWLSEQDPSGRVEDVPGWEPAYVRAPGAERAVAPRA